jgi:putative endonuclease
MGDRPYSIYLLRCGDGSLYTGIAIDVARRICEHQDGLRGAKYLRGRGPLELVFQQQVGARDIASRLEYRVKRLGRPRKEALISGQLRLGDLLSTDGSPGGQASGLACG